MCRSTVDIQTATTEIRQEKKRKKKQDKNIMSTSAMQGGHNQRQTKGLYQLYTTGSASPCQSAIILLHATKNLCLIGVI